jgi:hypothetical protein
MGMRFVNLPKSKQFRITTRFYDERKEAMREREERYRREMEENNGEATSSYASGIKGSFRTAGRKGVVGDRTLADARRKSNMRLLYILIVLLALLYFIMK